MKREIEIIDNCCFEYNEKIYNCSQAITRDTKLIIQEAKTSHENSFSLYDEQSLKADKIRVYLDEKNNPIFGFIIYLIDYKDGSGQRYACGGYYPFWDTELFPHPYQESICW